MSATAKARAGVDAEERVELLLRDLGSSRDGLCRAARPSGG